MECGLVAGEVSVYLVSTAEAPLNKALNSYAAPWCHVYRSCVYMCGSDLYVA